MGRSVVVEVRKAVIAGIRADLDAAGESRVSCTYGYRGASDDKRREEIYTNRPRGTHDPAAMKSGRNFRNEEMEFDIVLMVSDPTMAPEDLDERAMTLGTFIEEFVADNKNSLAVPGLNWIRMASFEMENRNMQTGSLTLAQYTVTYNARLT